MYVPHELYPEALLWDAFAGHVSLDVLCVREALLLLLAAVFQMYRDIFWLFMLQLCYIITAVYISKLPIRPGKHTTDLLYDKIVIRALTLIVTRNTLEATSITISLIVYSSTAVELYMPDLAITHYV